MNLSETQAEEIRRVAERLGVTPEALLRAGIDDFLTLPDEEFRRAADHVVRKNAELYRRLAS